MPDVRPSKPGVTMQKQFSNYSQFDAATALLAAGATVEQISESPQIYRLNFNGSSVPLPGGVFQQLLAHRRIRQSCRVSGRVRFVSTV